MGQRRNIGDWVHINPNVKLHFSHSLRLQIQDEGPFKCHLDCGDLDCRQWPCLYSEPDPSFYNVIRSIFHICECQMI